MRQGCKGLTMSPEAKKAWKIIRQKRRSNKDAYDSLANYCLDCTNCRDAASAFLSRYPGSDRVVDLMEKAHECPRCLSTARRLHQQIMWRDVDITANTKRILRIPNDALLR